MLRRCFDQVIQAEFSRLFLGPIFAKELRVASRRERTYLLRLAYLCALAVIVLFVWIEYVPYGGTPAFRIVMLAVAARRIALTVVWFQFVALQLVAALVFRRIAVCEAFGESGAPVSSIRAAPVGPAPPSKGGLRTVRGSPVMWWEARRPVFRTRRWCIRAPIVVAFFLVAAYVMAYDHCRPHGRW